MIISSDDRPLRSRAEERLAILPVDDRALLPEQTLRLIHELRVHQVELEIQNEELLETQQQLLIARDRYRELYDFAPVGYVTLSRNGRIMQANLTVERLLGREMRVLLRQPFTHFIAPDAQDAYHFLLQRLHHTDTPQTAELQMVRADGTLFWAHLDLTVATPDDVTDTEQQPAFRMTISDVTVLHTLQETEHRILDIVAHDIRVPATIISGYLPFLLDLLPTDRTNEKVEMIVGALQRALHRMHTMVTDLTEVTSLESDQLALKTEPIELTAYLSQLLPHYANVLDISRITLDIPATQPAVQADPDRLETIFVNLLMNAQKYSPSHTAIRISAVSRDNEVVISVCDQGQGISVEDVPHIFNRFFRAENGRHAAGLGLGLYITRKLVAAHGGHIGVESEVGAGSAFTFTLPEARDDSAL